MNTLASVLTVAAVVATGTSATAIPAIAPLHCVALTRSLAIGSRGDDVVKLQVLLDMEQQTGYFGPITRQEVIDWQIARNIIISAHAPGAGMVGPRTRAAMKCDTQPPLSSQPASTTAATSTATSTTPTTTTPVSTPASNGTLSVPTVSPYGYTCTPPPVQHPQSACTDGSWQLSADESGCVIWQCISSDDRG